MLKEFLKKYLLLLMSAFVIGYIIGFTVLNLKYFQNPNYYFVNFNYLISSDKNIYTSLVNQSSIREIDAKSIPVIKSLFSQKYGNKYLDITIDKLDEYQYILSFNTTLESPELLDKTKKDLEKSLVNLLNNTIRELAEEAIKVITFNYENQIKIFNEIYSNVDENNINYKGTLLNINMSYIKERGEFDYLIQVAADNDYYKFDLININDREYSINFMLPIFYGLIFASLLLFYLLSSKRLIIKIE